jgi:hypothetical protein
MIVAAVSAGIALVVGGFVIGAIAVVSLGIRRDDRRGRFPAEAAGRMALAARRVTGVGIRGVRPADDLISTRENETLAA